jgi:diadenosine tetraphosphate (Ap4A) HIT family hydrolase
MTVTQVSHTASLGDAVGYETAGTATVALCFVGLFLLYASSNSKSTNSDNAYPIPKYNNNNPFAKILRGKARCTKLYEDEHTLSFITYPAKTHPLLIPKGKYINVIDFAQNASDKEAHALASAIYELYPKFDPNSTNWYAQINTDNGPLDRQTVPHLHIHLRDTRSISKKKAFTMCTPDRIEIIRQSNQYTMYRTTESMWNYYNKREVTHSAWICFHNIHKLSELKSTKVNIFKPILHLMDAIGVINGFNLRLSDIEGCVTWQLDW